MPGPENDLRSLRNPVVLLAMFLVASVVALIGAAVFGLDKGVLSNMATPEYARGLITYLFAVVTIGTAVVLVLSVLISPADDVHKEQFQRGKEVLSLMLGVFGTIVGFYFGSSTTTPNTSSLRVSAVDVTPKSVKPGDDIWVRAVVSGGIIPYRYAVGFGEERPDPKEQVSENGWIARQLKAREFRVNEPSIVRLIVVDGSGKRMEETTSLEVKNPPGAK